MNRNVNQLIYEAYMGHLIYEVADNDEEIDVEGPVREINIYTKGVNGPIALSYKGQVISYNDSDKIIEISAVSSDTKEKIHVTSFNDNEEIKVSIIRNGNVIDQFVGTNMTFTDDDDPAELNIFKFDTV